MIDESTVLPVTTAVGAGPLDERPLLLFLHGFGSHERDLPGLAARLQPDVFQWASLRAPLDLSNGGYAWVPIVTPGKPDPDAVRAAARGILAWIDANVPESAPIVPIGFSQGGLMVSQLLRERHERFDAGVILSGFVLAESEPRDAELAAARIPVFFGRGDVDGVITEEAFAWSDQWLPEHTDVTAKVYPGLAHAIANDEVVDLEVFLGRVTAGFTD